MRIPWALALILAAPDGGSAERWEQLSKQTGKQLDGRVVSVVKNGAFVEVGGVEGFVHVSDMGWKREKNPAALVKAGQAVKVSVVQVNVEKREASLSMKRPEDDPWNTAPKRFAPGTKVKGTVNDVPESGLGIFLELEPEVDVLVHYTDLPPGKTTKDYRVGQVVELTVVKIDPARRRVGGKIP
jgi:small subunit ribosomal protein S1